MRLQHFLALLCLLTAPLLSNAQTNDPQFKRGVDLFNAKRYDQAVFILEPYADQGVEIALKFVSQAYMFGYGVPIDKQKALDQLRRAASIEKDGWANYLLANFHLKGSSGATQDDVKGLAYMERANQLGHKDAYQFLSEVFPGQYQLGDAPKTVSSSEVTHSNYEKTHAAESQNSVENLPKHESRAEVTSLTGLSLSEIQKKHGGKIEISKLEYKKNYNRLGKDLIATKCLDVSTPHQLHISCQGDKAINFNAFGFQLASAFFTFQTKDGGKFEYLKSVSITVLQNSLQTFEAMLSNRFGPRTIGKLVFNSATIREYYQRQGEGLIIQGSIKEDGQYLITSIR